MITRRNIITFGTMVLAATGLPAARAQEQRLKVVASFSILGDLARQVGGDRIEVTSIVGPNQDAHVFQPSPADARKLAGAALVIVNGLGFDTFMDKLVAASGGKPMRVTAAAGLDLMKKPAGATDDHGHKHGAAAQKDDPHVWQSIANARRIVQMISVSLATVDPAGKAAYDANLTSYLARLDALDAEFRAAIAALPPARRAFATSHDAFRYLARDYGLTSHAIQGVSPHAEASAGDLAKIIRQLKASKAPAVFLENVSDSRAIARIARETGAKLGGTLYSDALSLADGPVPSYIDLMRHNMNQLAGALAP